MIIKLIISPLLTIYRYMKKKQASKMQLGCSCSNPRCGVGNSLLRKQLERMKYLMNYTFKGK